MRGWAAEQLIARSASAELVVLGSRGLGGFTGLVAGSIAVAVATYGHCPIVVVRGADPETEPRDQGPVVVGVDGSPASVAAIPFAFRAAAERDVALVAVHTGLHMPVPGFATLGGEADWESLRREHQSLLEEWLGPTRAEFPDVPVVPVIARHGTNEAADQAEQLRRRLTAAGLLTEGVYEPIALPDAP